MKRQHGDTYFTTTTVARKLDDEPWAVSLDTRRQTEMEQHQHGNRSRKFS
ncbi:MAG: hypothetical protein OXD54_15880 [Candidatus Poribacteria bacterium]|nr:hypothetical protein [Candidatus Poribacteria bacterium]